MEPGFFNIYCLMEVLVLRKNTRGLKCPGFDNDLVFSFELVSVPELLT